MNRLIRTIFIVVLTFSGFYAQESDITTYLKKIEAGQKDEVKAALPQLLEESPDDCALIFLDGILTEDAKEAVIKFMRVVKLSPECKYADAALYRVYLYYYAIGSYKTAQDYLEMLSKNYPSSPYISMAEKHSEDNLLIKESKPEDKEKTKETIKKDTLQSYKDTVQVKKERSKEHEKTKSETRKYTLQVGAFLKEANAKSLVKELKQDGYKAYIKEKSIAGSQFFVVYVGEFTDESSAKEIAKKLDAKLIVQTRIVPLE